MLMLNAHFSPHYVRTGFSIRFHPETICVPKVLYLINYWSSGEGKGQTTWFETAIKGIRYLPISSDYLSMLGLHIRDLMSATPSEHRHTKSHLVQPNPIRFEWCGAEAHAFAGSTTITEALCRASRGEQQWGKMTWCGVLAEFGHVLPLRMIQK
jgi:hypothetical protein